MTLSLTVRRQRLVLAAAIGLGLLGTVATLLQPLLIGRVISAVSAGEPVVGPVAAIAGLFLADALLTAVHLYLLGVAGEGITLDLRTLLTGRLLHSRLAAFNRLEHGDVLNRTLGDTALARLAMTSALAQMVTSGATTLGCLVFMAVIDWRLLLAAVGSLTVASVVALVLARAVRMAAARNREDTSAYSSAVLRVLGGLTTVKASRAEEREAALLHELADTARRSGVRLERVSALFLPAINVGTQISLAVVITWGVARSATGTLGVADLAAFALLTDDSASSSAAASSSSAASSSAA